MSHDMIDRNLLKIENHLRDLTPEERDRILNWFTKDKQRAADIQKAIESLQNSLDTLRVLIKYTVFDLECTRRENVDLQEQVAQLQRVLEDKGYYAEDNVELLGEWAGDELPDAMGGMIELPMPEVTDFIHNTECDHAYDPDCCCHHCESFRDRRLAEGAD